MRYIVVYIEVYKCRSIEREIERERSIKVYIYIYINIYF